MKLNLNTEIREHGFKLDKKDCLCGMHTNQLIDNFFDKMDEPDIKSLYVSVSSEFMSFDKAERQLELADTLCEIALKLTK